MENLFPSSIMAGVAGEFTDLYGSYLETPQPFLFMSFLTCLGAVLADRLTLESEIRPQPRLYTILLGESADDRKSTAISKTKDFFKAALGDKFNFCMGIGSAEGLQRSLDRNSKQLLCFDEFKQVVSKCNIQASVLLPCLTTLFESNEYETNTKSKHFKMENAYVSLLAASTIQTYQNTWESAFTDIGFNNRLFLVPGSGERRFSIPTKISETEKRIIQSGLDNIIRFTERNPEIQISPEATSLYHEWYMGCEKSIHVKRLDVYALRLMTLLAANEQKSCVDEEIINKATALCDWQLEVRKLHDPIDADNKMAKMEGNIRRHLAGGPLSERDLRRKTNADRCGLWIFQTARDNLRKSSEICADSKTGTWKLTK
ncbi:MAG: hypothetical protein ACLQJ7_00340 [Syntrophobacteraceae bacterium]